jgi:DNA-binding transcriptional ArsR family regulator
MSTRTRTARRALADRPLFDEDFGLSLEALFKALANEGRLRMLHAIHRAGEISVSELADLVDMSPQAVSNQLQRLADRGVVRARREGIRINYRIVNRCVPELLDLAVCHVEQE